MTSPIRKALTLASPPETGLGDRMGTWMALLAVGQMLNMSVLINWKTPLGKMPEHVRNGSSQGGACIDFPSPAIVCGNAIGLPTCGATKAHMPLQALPSFSHWWPGTARMGPHGLECVPHTAYPAYSVKIPLLNRSRGHTLDLYMSTYRILTSRLRLRPECAHPMGDEIRAQQDRGRLVLFVHLRRTDKGGETDRTTASAGQRALFHRFENSTFRTIERVVQLLDEDGTSVYWVVASDNQTTAERCTKLLLGAKMAGSKQDVLVAPTTATMQTFFSMSESDGILQSIFAHGAWTSYSGVAALLHGAPLFSASLPVIEPAMYVNMDNLRHYGNATDEGATSAAANEKLFYTVGEERAFLAAAAAQRRSRRRRSRGSGNPTPTDGEGPDGASISLG